MLIPWEMIFKQNCLSSASCLDKQQRGRGLLFSPCNRGSRVFFPAPPPSLPPSNTESSLCALKTGRNSPPWHSEDTSGQCGVPSGSPPPPPSFPLLCFPPFPTSAAFLGHHFSIPLSLSFLSPQLSWENPTI